MRCAPGDDRLGRGHLSTSVGAPATGPEAYGEPPDRHNLRTTLIVVAIVVAIAVAAYALRPITDAREDGGVAVLDEPLPRPAGRGGRRSGYRHGLDGLVGARRQHLGHVVRTVPPRTAGVATGAGDVRGPWRGARRGRLPRRPRRGRAMDRGLRRHVPELVRPARPHGGVTGLPVRARHVPGRCLGHDALRDLRRDERGRALRA